MPHHGPYEITTDPARMDFARITAWLASSYWSPGITRDTVERAARHSSLLVGAFDPHNTQVAYLRVISDQTTFAYLADVWVDAAHRKRGLARAMVHHALSHPTHQGLRRWMLLTQDAHPLYESCGFTLDPHPNRIMTHRPVRT